MNKEIFIKKLKLGIISVFEEIEAKEEIFSFGIFTDQDISSMLVMYNTYSHFAEQLKWEFLRTHKIRKDFRWLMSEWFKRADEDNILFNEANDMLYKIIQPEESKTNPDFKDILINLLTNTLLELRENGLFDSMKEDAFIYFEQADSYIDDFMREKIKKLIGEKYFTEFLYDLRNEGTLGHNNPFKTLEQNILTGLSL